MRTSVLSGRRVHHLFPEGTVKCTHLAPLANSQRTPAEINKNGAIAKIKNFSGTSGTIRHLNTFTIISNEMRVLFLVLC